MPELSEVEIVRQNVERWLGGKTVAAVDLLDEEVVRQGEMASVEGGRVCSVRRRGKFLLIGFEEPAITAVVHFRMTGKLVRLEEDEERKARFTWRLDDGARVAYLDFRRLGHVDFIASDDLETIDLLREMGPEPWPEALSGADLKAALGKTRQAIKVALMDQRRVAGIGNILAAEACWQAEVDPRTPTNKVTDEELDRLGLAMKEVIDAILEAEMGEEVFYVNDPVAASEEFEHFMVYDRAGEPCRRCGEAIGKFTQSGRTTFWCETCQANA